MKDDLVTSNLKFVHYMIKKHFKVDPQEYDDIFQIGCMGLMKASKYYDASKSRFTTYASRFIYNEISMFYRLRRKKQKMIDVVSLETVVNDDGRKITTLADCLPDKNAELCDAAFDMEIIENAIAKMKTEQYKAICHDYIIRGLKQCEIAKKYKVSQGQVSRILIMFKKQIKEDWRS